MNTSRCNRRGFTLVEIMTVVVIVGILSSIAVPALMRVKRKAEDIVALNFLRQIYDAKERYFTEDGAGKLVVVTNDLGKAGYASQSLLSTITHPVGNWDTTAFRWTYLKPGLEVSLRERFTSGNRVSLGRRMVYPEDK